MERLSVSVRTAVALMLGIATIGIDSNPGVTPSVAAGGGIMLTEGG
jgi:hypothetical protein